MEAEISGEVNDFGGDLGVFRDMFLGFAMRQRQE